MRGNPLTMGDQFFIVGVSDNTYYYMMADPSKVGGVVMYSTNYYNITPSRVTITKGSNNSYYLRTNNGDGKAMYLSLNVNMTSSTTTLTDETSSNSTSTSTDNNVIDAISTSKVSITLTDDYGLSKNVLYPGLWYTIEGKMNTLPCTSTVTTPLCKASSKTSTLKQMKIQIIPINYTDENSNNQYGDISVWMTDSSGVGFCGGLTGETLSLQLFESWIGANTSYPQVNCNIAGPLSTQSNNCVFSSFTACDSKYLYEYSSGECGNEMGVCSQGCRYSQTTPPFTCLPQEPNEEDEEETKRYLIVFIIFIVVLILIVIVLRSYGKGDKTTTVNPT